MQRDDLDARLMLAFRDGDDSALANLYRHWAGPLLRYLERIVRDRETAEELVQETFIRVHHAKERYAANARFSTWLFRIARNLALNELDLARRRKPHISTDAPRGARGEDTKRRLALVSSTPTVESAIDTRRTRELVDSALGELPERQRSALWLRAVEGYSYAEIAETLETSVPSIKSLIHRARATISERVTDPSPQDSSDQRKSGQDNDTRASDTGLSTGRRRQEVRKP